MLSSNAAESFLAAQEILSVPEDTAERQFSQQVDMSAFLTLNLKIRSLRLP